MKAKTDLQVLKFLTNNFTFFPDFLEFKLCTKEETLGYRLYDYNSDWAMWVPGSNEKKAKKELMKLWLKKCPNVSISYLNCKELNQPY